MLPIMLTSSTKAQPQLLHGARSVPGLDRCKPTHRLGHWTIARFALLCAPSGVHTRGRSGHRDA
jgi:hypothetical protein